MTFVKKDFSIEFPCINAMCLGKYNVFELVL